MKERGYMVSKQQDDMKAMQMLHLRIDDIQEIILQQLNQKRASGADGFSPSEFSAAIRSAVGQQLTADELSLLFRVYNKKGDGRLSTTDVLRFLCDHQGKLHAQCRGSSLRSLCTQHTVKLRLRLNPRRSSSEARDAGGHGGAVSEPGLVRPPRQLLSFLLPLAECALL